MSNGRRVEVPALGTAGATSGRVAGFAPSMEAVARELCRFRADTGLMVDGINAMRSELEAVPGLLGEIRNAIRENSRSVVAAIEKMGEALDKLDDALLEVSDAKSVVGEIREEVKKNVEQSGKVQEAAKKTAEALERYERTLKETTPRGGQGPG